MFKSCFSCVCDTILINLYRARAIKVDMTKIRTEIMEKLTPYTTYATVASISKSIDEKVSRI